MCVVGKSAPRMNFDAQVVSFSLVEIDPVDLRVPGDQSRRILRVYQAMFEPYPSGMNDFHAPFRGYFHIR